MFRTLLVALFLALCGGGAAAETIDDLTAEVPSIPGKTWVDLLKSVFSNIDASGGTATAKELIDLRSIGAGNGSWIGCDDGVRIGHIDAARVQIAGRDRIIVAFVPPDDCVGLLALFAAEDGGKLLDAVNVKGDQHVSFPGYYIRPLGPSGVLAIASTWHDNSNQSYDIDTLVLASADGFTAIGDVFAFGDRTCRERMTQSLSLRAVPDGAPMARIVAEVKRSIEKLAEDCETKKGRPSVTTYSGYWRWNAAKRAYEAHTKELDQLAAWNAKRF